MHKKNRSKVLRFRMPAVAKSSKVKNKPKEAVKQPLVLSNRSNKRSPKNLKNEQDEKGIIYVKHLPHGFFERQLRSFFNQFGDVTRVHVARSKKTLRSRGYAYVEFRYREVAQIAAETMNNYLMFGKILKTGVLPAGAKRIPRKYEKAFDSDGKETTTYKLWLKKMVAKSNGPVTKTKVADRNIRALAKLNKLKKRYAQMGVDYNVDDVIPEFEAEDLLLPEHDAEEEQNRANRERKKAKKAQKVDKLESFVLSKESGEPMDDTTDDDDEDFLPLKSTDWDASASEDDESLEDNEGQEQDEQHSKKQTKSAAVEFATKIKRRIDREKKKNVDKTPKGPLVLRPISSEESSPEKTSIRKWKQSAKDNAESSPDNSENTAKRTKSKKLTGGVKKGKGKLKEKKTVRLEGASHLKVTAKALIRDPTVKKVKAKDISKKKKK